MDNNIAAIRTDVEVRPDPAKQTSGKAAEAQSDGGKQTSGKAPFARLIEYLAPVLMVLACLSLVCAVGFLSNHYETSLSELMKKLDKWQQIFLVACWLIWVTTMGCIGGIASLGMQAIKVPEVDSVLDISDWHLAMLRVILGGLFALVSTVAI